MPVVEMDEVVERKAGMKISDIFEKHGESRFRALEAQAVEEACKKTGAVLSLGGGALLDAACARAVQKSCIAVWLWASADESLSRLKGDSSRPLLKKPGKAKAARSLLSFRLPIYAICSDIAVGTEGKSAKKVAGLVMDETDIALQPAQKS
ncbi:MAG: hypothetical protein NT051_06625 [Candidatus Micrarchaeota archaeon]|nr:hypothetical protein [Candidatus Micrarchaeota archaeon]